MNVRVCTCDRVYEYVYVSNVCVSVRVCLWYRAMAIYVCVVCVVCVVWCV